MDFLEYAYQQLGDDARAKAIVDELAAIHRDDLDEEFRGPYDVLRAYFPAAYALETRQWKDALSLQPPRMLNRTASQSPTGRGPSLPAICAMLPRRATP